MSEVSLVNYSQPMREPLNILNAVVHAVSDKPEATLKEQVAHCARVSNPSNQNNKDVDGLLNYLIKHKHWSPFEMVSVCLEINTTRDIARQILRHRSFSFQEFSQRYADPTELGYEIREARLQDPKNRQNSIELTEYTGADLKKEFEIEQELLAQRIMRTYRWALSEGIAKEQARAILPEGMMKSRMYMNGTLRSWIHYIELRSGPETQKEHREVAIQCAKAIEPIFADVMKVLQD
jgi:thymidylate synthase (FAD)